MIEVDEGTFEAMNISSMLDIDKGLGWIPLVRVHRLLSFITRSETERSGYDV